MSMTWRYIKPIQNESAISDFCNLHGVTLPDRLVEFLTEHNAGRPAEPVFNSSGAAGRVFNSLFSYNDTDATSITKVYGKRLDLPNLYPVAIEASGNTICFDLGSGKLVLFNHETGGVETIDTNSNVELFEGLV